LAEFVAGRSLSIEISAAVTFEILARESILRNTPRLRSVPTSHPIAIGKFNYFYSRINDYNYDKFI
jgi:hypothetical protein